MFNGIVIIGYSKRIRIVCAAFVRLFNVYRRIEFSASFSFVFFRAFIFMDIIQRENGEPTQRIFSDVNKYFSDAHTTHTTPELPTTRISRTTESVCAMHEDGAPENVVTNATGRESRNCGRSTSTGRTEKRKNDKVDRVTTATLRYSRSAEP